MFKYCNVIGNLQNFSIIAHRDVIENGLQVSKFTNVKAFQLNKRMYKHRHYTYVCIYTKSLEEIADERKTSRFKIYAMPYVKN